MAFFIGGGEYKDSKTGEGEANSINNITCVVEIVISPVQHNDTQQTN